GKSNCEEAAEFNPICRSLLVAFEQIAEAHIIAYSNTLKPSRPLKKAPQKPPRDKPSTPDRTSRTDQYIAEDIIQSYLHMVEVRKDR
ncbi:hypothetical protein GIB67_037036, partial [Kingdonia uniflora]